jgi:cell division protease FtsH
MRNGRNFLIWIGILILLVVVYDAIQGGMGGKASVVAFSDFLDDVDRGQVQKVTISGSTIEGQYKDGSAFTTTRLEYPRLVEELKAAGVRLDVTPSDTAMNSFIGVLISWFPILLLIGVWVFFMRQMQSGGGKGGAMGFGRSRAKVFDVSKQKTTFKDVAGIEEAKEDLHEVVDFLKDPDKFSALGGKIPKGCLLVGSPGTGKTLLAKAIAGEAGVPFFSISGSDFVEMFVGVGASRVRDLFEQGKKNAPCLIFIDEIDAVGRHRGAGLGGGNDEREQTLNQLLVEMDGFEENEGIIIIAATNRPDVLDPALLRPGRFDRQIMVPLPDIKGRDQILKVHLAKVPTGPDVDANVIARGTPGFTGADLANLVNEGALMAARSNKKVVTMHELEQAKDKVMMGAERKSMVIGEEERQLTAYHEAGHAIVGLHCEFSDPIHKATIIPRGRALGMVMRLPEKDRLSLTRGKAKADIAVAMGGRVAEEMIFGYQKVTSGASSDIKMATSLARSMVSEWGMSDKIGPIFHGSDQEEVFLGKSMTHQKHNSEETANLIDTEVKGLVDEGYKLAHSLLKKHKKELEALAKGLLEYETLTGDEITQVIKGKKLDRTDKKKKPTQKKGSVPDSKSDDDDTLQPEAVKKPQTAKDKAKSVSPEKEGEEKADPKKKKATTKGKAKPKKTSSSKGDSAASPEGA